MANPPILGGELLRLLTTGMYNSPLVLYREYVQNAADAVTARGSSGGCVRITIDPLNSQITILDDGAGLSPSEAVRRLINVGCSPKDVLIDRGFRGIGRLAGLAFVEELHFTTRSCGDYPPTRVSWNARTLRELDLTRVDAQTAIEESTTTSQVLGGKWPERFFQVTMDRISRHAASTLLNEDAVRSYLAEVCPVPMTASFPFSADVEEFLTSYIDHLVLDIRINDNPQLIERPFQDVIPLTDNFGAPFETLETRIIPRIDGEDPAGVLWLAHTPYAGSIPRRLGIRGLRARIGNMQIGTDRVFEHLFQEPRFNGWCVGEIHILDRRIVPNGQRDYFEPSPHLRNLENHVGAITQQISLQCRRASSQRNKLRTVDTAINRLKAARNLVCSGYLRPRDSAALIERERNRIPAIRQILAQVRGDKPETALDTVFQYESEFRALETGSKPVLNDIPLSSRATVQSAFGTIVSSLPPNSALELIEEILKGLPDSHIFDDTGLDMSDPIKTADRTKQL